MATALQDMALCGPPGEDVNAAKSEATERRGPWMRRHRCDAAFPIRTAIHPRHNTCSRSPESGNDPPWNKNWIPFGTAGRLQADGGRPNFRRRIPCGRWRRRQSPRGTPFPGAGDSLKPRRTSRRPPEESGFLPGESGLADGNGWMMTRTLFRYSKKPAHLTVDGHANAAQR